MLYISHSAVFWLLWVINDNGHLPNINSVHKQDSEITYDKCAKIYSSCFVVYTFLYIPHKMGGILKFHLHIIMHEITALVMLCIERKGIDLTNQEMQPFFFSEPQELVLLIPFNQRNSSKGNIVCCTFMASSWWFSLI